MFQNIQKFWKALDRDIVVSKRELFLGVTSCTLAGILVGIMFSPKKILTIGSNNASNNTGNTASSSEEAATESPTPGADGE